MSFLISKTLLCLALELRLGLGLAEILFQRVFDFRSSVVDRVFLIECSRILIKNSYKIMSNLI